MTDWLVRSARVGQLGRAAPTVRAELTVRAESLAATGAAVLMVFPACPDWRACRALPVSLEPPAAVVRPVRRALLEMPA
jgi:hypothetical protein